MKPKKVPPTTAVFFALLMIWASLSGCSQVNPLSSTLTPGATCGNGTCDNNETSSSCAIDCRDTKISGQTQMAYINSEGVGDIAVMIATPKAARFPEGAGVVVIATPIFSTTGGFLTDPDVTSLGLIQISYLWPGTKDTQTGALSSGTFDYGGEQSVRVLRDVIRFASGLLPDKKGVYLPTLVPVSSLTGEVGLYAFGEASITVVNVLRLYGDVLPGVQYFVGRENPTLDTLSCLEAGYLDDSGNPIFNPFYNYPASYSSSSINLTYPNILWDAAYKDQHTGAVGIAFLDLDGNKTATADDYIMSWKVPVMFGKRYYSAALTQSLLYTGALTLSIWPEDLATPEEAARDWSIRRSTNHYVDLRLTMPNLKVMLVFAQADHIQVAQDKPHIHQAFQGFRFEAGLWVRLNPDRAYVQSLLPSAGLEFPDNPADTQPDNWMQIQSYAYPGQGSAEHLVPLAAAAEMADRVHFGRWDENLGQVLYIYFPPTLQP